MLLSSMSCCALPSRSKGSKQSACAATTAVVKGQCIPANKSKRSLGCLCCAAEFSSAAAAGSLSWTRVASGGVRSTSGRSWSCGEGPADVGGSCCVGELVFCCCDGNSVVVVPAGSAAFGCVGACIGGVSKRASSSGASACGSASATVRSTDGVLCCCGNTETREGS